jgi:CubicO group peptidase (beta-lactamase class C family)
VRLDAWKDRLEQLVAAHRVPGASVAVLADGTVLSLAAGVLNTSTGVAATPDSLFQVGSISKTVSHVVSLARCL